MFRRLLLKLTVGMVAGAFAVGALFPMLMMVPSFAGLAIVIFAFGSAVILSATAEELRQAAGRCLMMLGATLVLMPILSITLGTFTIGLDTDLSVKSDKLASSFEPVSWQMFAAFVAFGAGSIVSIAGIVVALDGRNGLLHPVRQRRKKELPNSLASKAVQATDTRRDEPRTQAMQVGQQSGSAKHSIASVISLRQEQDETPTRDSKAGGQRLPSSTIKMRSGITANWGVDLRASGMSHASSAASHYASRSAAIELAARAAEFGARQQSGTGLITITPIVPQRWRNAEVVAVSATGNGLGRQKLLQAPQLTPPREITANGKSHEANPPKQDRNKYGTNKITATRQSATPRISPVEINESKLVGTGSISPTADEINLKAERTIPERKPLENVVSNRERAGTSQGANQPSIVVELPEKKVDNCTEDHKSEKQAQPRGKSDVTLMDRNRHLHIAQQIKELANSARRPETKENDTSRAPNP